MLKTIFTLLLICFFCIGSVLVGVPYYQFALRSKQFDCTYLFRHDLEKQQTIIDVRFDGNNIEGNETHRLAKQPKSYEISEIITESTLVKEGSFESLIGKTQQEQLVYIILKDEPIVQPIGITPILEQFIPGIKNTAYSFKISTFAAGDEQLYLAVSIDSQEHEKQLVFLTAFFINYHPKTGFCIIPLAIKQITQENYSINKMQFDHDFKRLFCAGHPGLLCTSLKSETVTIDHQQKTIQDIVIAQNIYFKSNTNNIINLVYMTTSTALSYIILHNKTNNSIKTFPISADHMIASKHASIDDIFYLDGIKHFLYRRLLGTMDFHETIDECDPAVSVGAMLDIGIIQKVKVYGDSIVVLTEQIQNEWEKKSYCLYKSTALFHANGLIKDWTNWQLIHHTVSPIVDFEFDRIRGEFLILHPEHISFSGWTLKNYHKTNIRFNDACIASLPYNQNSKIDFFAAISGNILFFGPLDTALTDFEALQKWEICCSTLQNIHLCPDPYTKKLYCFIASDMGIIEVIIDDNGIITAIEKAITNLMNIKKIIIDQDYLFALSDKALYRVKKNDRANFDLHDAENILDPLLQNSCGTFLDMIVSDSLLILSSTRGLWNIKPGYSTTHAAPIMFEKTHLPHHIGFPSKLYALSKDGFFNNVARYQGGNIQVLCVDYSLRRSQLYRFSVTPTKQKNTSEHTLQPFHDIILYHTNAPFINFGSLQQDCFFDGIRYLLPSSLQQISLSSFPRLGKIMSGNNLIQIPRTDFQNERILYTGIYKQKTLVIISDHGIYCYE